MVRQKKIMFNILMLFLLFFGIGASGVSALEQDGNLHQYLKLENDAIDSSWYGTDGINNGVTFNGNEAIFDGSDYIDVTTPDKFSYPYSASGWVYIDTSDTSINHFLYTMSKSGDINYLTSMDVRYTGTWDVRFLSKTTLTNLALTDSTSITSTGWYHVVFTISNSQKKIYVNGINTATDTQSINIPPGVNQATVGALLDSTPVYGKGSMKGFTYYNKVLSPTEVTDLYNNGVEEVPIKPEFKGINNYYELFNNASDSMLNNDGTNFGVTFTGSEGIFDGSDYIDTDYYVDGYSEITASVDVYWDSSNTNTFHTVLDNRADGGSPVGSIQLFYDDNNQYWRATLTTTNGQYNLNDWAMTDSEWTKLTLTYDGSFFKVYKNETEVKSTSATGNLITSGSLTIGDNGDNVLIDREFKGSLKNTQIFNRALNQTEVAALYTEVNQFSDLFETGTAITFNYPQQGDFINTSTFELNVSFSEITNSSYIFNGGVETTLGTNENESLKNITGVEGVNNLTVFTNTNGDLTNSSINFTIDLTPPTIDVIGNLTQNEFLVNFSNIFNVTDALSGLASCTINITYLENIANASQYDKFINCTDTITFGAAGNYNGLVEAEDNAGNKNTLSVNGSIIPFVYIFFEDESNNPISNYDVTITHPDGRVITFLDTSNPVELSPVNDGVLDLGVHTLSFSKEGYVTQNFQVDINVTSSFNQTFTTSFARILLYIRDQNDDSLITGTNFSVEFVASVGLETSTTTGVVNISNLFFENENYQVIVTNPDYQTETKNFDFTNREEIVLDVHMINKTDPNLGVVFIAPVDNFGNSVVGANVFALQWDSSISDHKEVSSAVSGSDGLGTVNVILNDKTYLFRAEYQGLIGTTPTSEIIDDTENGKTIAIRIQGLDQEYNYLLENVITDVTEEYNNETNISTITFEYTSSIGEIDVCINEYLSLRGSERLETEDCIQGTSGTYQVQYIINNSYYTTLKAEIKVDGVRYTVDSFNYEPKGSIDKVLDDLNLAIFVVPFLFLAAIAIAMMIENVTIGTIAMAILAGTSLILAPNILTKGIVAFLFFVAWATINYGVKSK